MCDRSKSASFVSNERAACRYDIPDELMNNYLPDILPSFVSKSLTTLVKRSFTYLTPILLGSSSQLDAQCLHIPFSTTLDDSLKASLSSHRRYNFILTGTTLLWIATPHTFHASDRLLCKHVTLANKCKDIRFAGEFWCDENNVFRLNNNSGTYRPSDALLEQTVQFFQQLTPCLQFRGESFRASRRPSMKDRLFFCK